jgi:hypothetical protein
MTAVLCTGPAFCPPSILLPQKSVATVNCQPSSAYAGSHHSKVKHGKVRPNTCRLPAGCSM